MLIQIRKFMLIMTLLAFSGCATLPTGPSVRVLPGQGKSFEQFQSEDVICRQWAGQQTGISAQEVADQSTVSGAAIGTAVGAGVGAAIGAASGHAGTGAAIGAGSGLLFGASAGADSGRYYGYEAQRRYDIAYAQCMYAKGNQIPGVVIRRSRWIAPPPPPRRMYPVPPDYVPPYQ
jgi:hypothetical protein